MTPQVRAGVRRPPVRALEPSALRRRYDPYLFDFDTTEQLPNLEGVVGQERAVQAVRLAVGIGSAGDTVFAFGPPGTGKPSLVIRALERHAEGRPAPGPLLDGSPIDGSPSVGRPMPRGGAGEMAP